MSRFDPPEPRPVTKPKNDDSAQAVLDTAPAKPLAKTRRHPDDALTHDATQTRLGWAGLGWAGLGWAGLGWAGAGLGWAGLDYWAGLGWAGLGYAWLGWAGLGWTGLDSVFAKLFGSSCKALRSSHWHVPFWGASE